MFDIDEGETDVRVDVERVDLETFVECLDGLGEAEVVVVKDAEVVVETDVVGFFLKVFDVRFVCCYFLPFTNLLDS